MRLTPRAREIIRDTTREVFGEAARSRLFGSRVDDSQRGGDIDLLIELPAYPPRRFRHGGDHMKASSPAARSKY